MYPTAGFLRFITLLVLALTASISIAAKQQPPSEVLASSSLDNIEKLLSKGEVAGMAIAIVKNGRVQRTKSFGWRNAALKTQIGNDTIFEVASLSKPVVAYGVLQLVDRRLIGIDDPASKYIDSPELRDDTRWKTLTIMMLLDHTSGLPNELRPGERLSFSFTPGTRFSYSGIGFLFLQQIVEKVTRLSFEQYMETAIFKPLHMTSSSFVWRDDYDTRKANGHDNIGRPTAIRKPMVPKAPSSLHTSAADYARLLAAVLGRSGLSASRWKAMVTPQIPVQQDCVVCISKAAGQLSSAVEWGLGWGLEKTDHGSYVFHWGENNGDFPAFVEGDPSTQTGIVILTNSGNGFSIVPAIVQQIFPGKHEAFTWMGYDSYDSPFKTVLRRILAEGPEKVLSGADPQLSELQWNRIGYNLVARSKAREAIEVFEHNVSLHPKSSNVYDSLAEAYAAAGRTTEAIESYRRSLVLDPDNDNARQMIKKLQNSNAILQQMRGRWLGGMKLIDGRALTVAVNAVSTGKVETVLWPKNGREVDIRFHSRISSNSDGVDLIDEDGSDTLTGTVSDNEVHGYASFGAEHVKGEIALVQVNEGLSGNAAFDALGQRGFLGPEAFHELASAALKANDMQGALKWLRLGKQAKPGFPDALLFATDLAPIRRTREFKQLFEDPVASYAELSQATHSIKIERSVHIPMRDGIKLLADIYRPDEAERYPVILIRSPYGRGTDIPPDDVAHYAARGYVVVIEAVRGTDGSEGEFQPWLNERKDGYDSIDWVSKQQWSIAKVGMLGLSYLGQAQWAAAVEAHPALKCIIPEVSGTDHMLDTPYDHGILRLELLGWSRNFVPIPKGSFSRPPLDDDLIGLPLSAIDTAYTGHALPVWHGFWNSIARQRGPRRTSFETSQQSKSQC